MRIPFTEFYKKHRATVEKALNHWAYKLFVPAKVKETVAAIFEALDSVFNLLPIGAFGTAVKQPEDVTLGEILVREV
jgi:hypothetical protein